MSVNLVLFVAALKIRALLFGVCIRAVVGGSCHIIKSRSEA